MPKKSSHLLSDYFFITVAGIVNAFGITCFLYPVNLYDSGISGTSMLLAQITPESMTLSLFLILLNVPLFFYGYRRMGPSFTMRSVYAVCIYSLVAWLISDVLPVDVSVASPLAEQDLLLCAIFGGLISGVGSGMTIRFGGAIDGLDILGVLFAKKLNVSIGTFVMIFNVILYTVAGVMISSWILPLYSMITYAAATKAVDFIAEGLDKAKAVIIISDHAEEICTALSEEFRVGITLLPAKGFFSDTDKTMVYFVVNRFQINKVRTIVRSCDSRAYMTISEISDVFASEAGKKS